MTKTMKNTLRSVLVMTVIAAVAVTLLALANAFFPKYEAKLDKKTAGLIVDLLDLGISDDEAYNGGYIEMEALDADKLAAFNETAGADQNNKVLAVYTLKKGDKTGYRVVESQAKGYNDPSIVLLTSFATDNKIDSTIVKQQNENPQQNSIFEADRFAAFVAYIKGKTAIAVDEIKAETGATSAVSMNGLSNAVNIAAKFVAQQYGGESADRPTEVTGASLLAALKKAVPGAQSFTSYPVPADKKEAVYGVYESDTGTVVVAGNSVNAYGWVRLVVTTDTDNRVGNICLVDFQQSAFVMGMGLTDEKLMAAYGGKTADELLPGDISDVVTGASYTQNSVVEAMKNSIGNTAWATGYVAGWEA